jgi:hypothetical protein
MMVALLDSNLDLQMAVWLEPGLVKRSGDLLGRTLVEMWEA